jgi:hypothetical protein
LPRLEHFVPFFGIHSDSPKASAKCQRIYT